MAQKGHKIGRNKKRPSAQRYKAENRASANARKAQAKHKANVASKQSNPPKRPRGTARAKRREELQRMVA